MDLGAWLKQTGFERYEAAFRDNGIDEAVLPNLTVEDLKESASRQGRRSAQTISAILHVVADCFSRKYRAAASATEKVSEISAERRPITVMFCDLVGSTALASRLDAEDWRSLVNAYLDEAAAAVTSAWRPRAEEARRRAHGPLRLSDCTRERRRARGAGGARDPALPFRDQCQERLRGRAGALRAYRTRGFLGRS